MPLSKIIASSIVIVVDVHARRTPVDRRKALLRMQRPPLTRPLDLFPALHVTMPHIAQVNKQVDIAGGNALIRHSVFVVFVLLTAEGYSDSPRCVWQCAYLLATTMFKYFICLILIVKYEIYRNVIKLNKHYMMWVHTTWYR